jgi:hypothetical protein
VSDYEQVMIWFDNPLVAQQVGDELADHLPFRKENMRSVVPSQDANALLVTGELEEMVATL